MGPVVERPLADAVEYLDRQSAGIARRPQHQRRHRADQDELGDPSAAMAADIAGDLAAAGGMADQHDVLQVEFLDQARQVVGIAVNVVAVPGLIRTAMAAPVMSDDAIAFLA